MVASVKAKAAKLTSRPTASGEAEAVKGAIKGAIGKPSKAKGQAKVKAAIAAATATAAAAGGAGDVGSSSLDFAGRAVGSAASKAVGKLKKSKKASRAE